MPIDKLIREMEQKSKGTEYEPMMEIISKTNNYKKTLNRIISQKKKNNESARPQCLILENFNEAIVYAAGIILGEGRPTTAEMRALAQNR